MLFGRVDKWSDRLKSMKVANAAAMIKKDTFVSVMTIPEEICAGGAASIDARTRFDGDCMDHVIDNAEADLAAAKAYALTSRKQYFDEDRGCTKQGLEGLQQEKKKWAATKKQISGGMATNLKQIRKEHAARKRRNKGGMHRNDREMDKIARRYLKSQYLGRRYIRRCYLRIFKLRYLGRGYLGRRYLGI